MKTVDIDVSKVDWKDIRRQKRWLASISCDPRSRAPKKAKDCAEGLLSFLDDIQDQAALQLGDRKVFGK